MLVSREESSFDFNGAQFDLDRDREVLGWIFSQFLYGEVTGVQVGRWIERAPSFQAAQFLARQANEEMAHVKVFLRILDCLGVPPKPAHRALSFLASDFAGGTFVEHCFLEMALGEGFVLTAIYALIDTLPDSEIRTLLRGLSRQEESHVSFGEEQTQSAIARDPKLARHLLGLAFVSLSIVGKFAAYARQRFGNHPVLARVNEFTRHASQIQELRMRRIGIVNVPLSSFTSSERGVLIATSLARRYGRALNPLRQKPTTLPMTYLAEFKR
ncbi:MAG: ferritin-like domain-containing protein [Actinomycetota bacterium]